MGTSDLQSGIKEAVKTFGDAGLPGKAVLVFLLAGLLATGAAFGLMETNEAGYITIKQSILTGKVSIISEPGLFCQCFGAVTKYKEAGAFKFVRMDESPGGKTRGKPRKGNAFFGPEVYGEIEVRFNDGGRGWISGMVLFDLPTDTEQLGLVHKKFRSFDKLIEAGMVPTIKEAVILTAALMSSGESYTTKRAIFSEWARDQVSHGTYLTADIVKEEKDPKTGHVIEKNLVVIRKEGETKLRNENPLERYGITLKQFQITSIRYESDTENLIKVKREALQKTIVAKISAERAIQERLAAEEFGKKNVKVAEYEALIKKKKAEVAAEEEKAVAVIMAERKLAVAKIRKQQELGAANKKVELEKLSKVKALIDRKSTRLNSSHTDISRMPSSA